MKAASMKRKNYYLDEAKIKKIQKILGTKTETETINKSDLLESLKKVSGKGGVQKD